MIDHHDFCFLESIDLSFLDKKGIYDKFLLSRWLGAVKQQAITWGPEHMLTNITNAVLCYMGG